MQNYNQFFYPKVISPEKQRSPIKIDKVKYYRDHSLENKELKIGKLNVDSSSSESSLHVDPFN